MKTERFTLLVSPAQKATILARARNLGLTAAEFIRRAVSSYEISFLSAEKDEAKLNALADELFAAASSARKALNEANSEIRATLKELARRRKTG